MRVWVDGAPLDFMVDGYGDLEWSTDGHGCKESAVGFYSPLGTRNPKIRRGARYEVMIGTHRAWLGLLAEPNWDEGTLTAYGLAREAEAFQALDGAGDSTSISAEAADRAIGLGWGVTRGSGIPTTAYTTEAEGPNSVGALLASEADERGERWFVEEDGVLDMAPDPLKPSWHIDAGVVKRGLLDHDFASAVAVRYLDAASSTYETVIVVDEVAAEKYGYRELPADATVLGPISAARAEGIGNGLLEKGQARLGWTAPIDVSAVHLSSPGDVPAQLWRPKARQVVRIFGEHEDGAYLDVGIGETNYAANSGSVRLSPFGTAAQSWADMVEQILLIASGRTAS